MLKLFKEYSSLPIPNASNEFSFSARPIRGFANHRIAKNRKDCPSLLIKVSNSNESGINKRIVNQKLFNLSIKHNLECEVFQKKKKSKMIYSVISYTGEEQELKNYFLEICEILLHSIGKSPNVFDLKKTINKFIELFRVLNEPPKKSLQGLWAELFIINSSKYPKRMLEGWHNTPEERFDFSLKKKKIEVKSTKSRSRIHYFSSEQLTPIDGCNIFIFSILVEESSAGLGISDLLKEITKKIKGHQELIEKLNIVVFSTLSSDISKMKDCFYDRELAFESLKIFNIADVPKILPQHIPEKISNVKFQVSLEGIPFSNNFKF